MSNSNMTNLEQLLEGYNRLGVATAIKYNEYNNILITAHSTRIEGSTISFAEATELIQNKNTPVEKTLIFLYRF